MTSDPVGKSPDLDRGPSLLLPALVTIMGVALALHELVELIRHLPAAGRPRSLDGVVLALALALGGFSGTRLLQLMTFAGARHRRAVSGAGSRAAGGSDGSARASERTADEIGPEVPWQLTDAQSVHGVWVIAVGGSLALMGMLGLWSALDGQPSGLEPGWPLLLLGVAVALLGRMAWLRTSAHWSGAGDGF